MAGLHAPLPTLRSRPRGRPRTAWGRCGLLLLHRSGLSPHTPCRSPGALTRVAACTLARSPIRDPLIEGFRHFVTSMTAPIASGWSESPGALHPLESAALSRRTPLAVLPVGACDRRLGWRAAIRNQRPETAVGCRIWTIVADEIAEVQSTTH